jgi:hypothetical protein
MMENVKKIIVGLIFLIISIEFDYVYFDIIFLSIFFYYMYVLYFITFIR